MKTIAAWVLILAGLAAPVARAATCPFGIPVVALPPHTQNGFSWGWPIRPMGDACVSEIAVEPTNSAAWYVAGQNGLYMTKNAGATWTLPLGGAQAGPLLLVPGTPQLVYVARGTQLYLSRDHGANWSLVHNYPRPIASILTTPTGLLYVGLAWSDHVLASGVWRSNLGGGGAVFLPFGAGQTGLIVWTLSRDPLDGTLYAGTEIFDHPAPYQPPFFRSTDGGLTWADVSAGLPWHVVDSAVRPLDHYLYALTEGPGLYGSPDHAATWQQLSVGGPSVSLLMDPGATHRLYGGRQKVGLVNGGAFQSLDAGQTFQPIGLAGVTVSGLALNGAGTRFYAVGYASGIYVSTVP
jgi:hypothetical protein